MSSEVWLNGLPPVGCECEVTPHNTLWGFPLVVADYGCVVAYDGEDFWWKNNTGFNALSRTDKVDFRPLQTKADTEREEAIKEIDALLTTAQDEDQPMANVLYENGYHNGPKMGEAVGGKSALNMFNEEVKCRPQDYISWPGWLDDNFIITRKVVTRIQPNTGNSS